MARVRALIRAYFDGQTSANTELSEIPMDALTAATISPATI
jgi:hypothetical protein